MPNLSSVRRRWARMLQTRLTRGDGGGYSDSARSGERCQIFCSAGQYHQSSYGAPLDSRPDAKIVVFGLPKSGNVWLVSLLSDYTGLKPIDPFTDVSARGVGMCHLPYSEEIASRGDFIHGVYLVRDLRDLIVSYFWNSQTEWFQKTLPSFHYPTIEQFYYEWFLPRVVPFHRILTHAEEFTIRGVPPVSYERLYDNPVEELGRLIKRLGLHFDRDRVAAVVEMNTIDRLRNSGKQLDVFVPETHFRKGGYGNYARELPPKIIAHVNEVFGDVLKRWGYEI
jgi:Sulfotransferase domain